MKLLRPFISSIARRRMGDVNDWILHPLTTQREVLHHLTTTARHTEYGRKYNFEQIFTVKDFKNAVPISEYPDLNPYISRMMDGAKNILWPGAINWFAKSSGTTSGRSKFVPLSKESFKEMHFKAGKDLLTNYYNNFPDSGLLTGKGLAVGGSHQLSSPNGEIRLGDLSALLMQNSPFWGQWLRTPELKIAVMDNWEDKIEEMARSTVQENVTSIAGVPTWSIILIKRILEITGKSCLSEVWPNIELFLHGGVSFTPYKNEMCELIGKPINYLEVYNASEGFFAAQSSPDDEGMLLFTNHGIYYEFIPIEAYRQSEKSTIDLSEVEVDHEYVLVISTNGGMWRYVPGDTITFTSVNPFKIKVTGRTKYYINAFGEEVIAENADQAITQAASETGASIVDYTAAPLYFSQTENGAHQWLVEFEKSPSNEALFAQVLDQTLRSINSDYDAKRFKDIALREPEVRHLPKNTFKEWLRSKGKLGGQHKIPRLNNDRKMAEEILSVAKELEG